MLLLLLLLMVWRLATEWQYAKQRGQQKHSRS